MRIPGEYVCLFNYFTLHVSRVCAFLKNAHACLFGIRQSLSGSFLLTAANNNNEASVPGLGVSLGLHAYY